MATVIREVRTLAAEVDTIDRRNRAAGDSTGAALLALHRGIANTHPDLFAEVSALLHGALNDMTHIAFITDRLADRLPPLPKD